jgi:glycosyltransferase involved in cell wall biosynthesis
MKPVLFVTGHAPFDRVGAFARLSAREDVEFALFGGRSRHGPSRAAELPSAGADVAYRAGEAPSGEIGLPFPHHPVDQRQIWALAASGRYRAVVCSTGGRLALPAAWAGARRARVPLILWTALWAHPRSAAHLFSYQALRRLYRSADAVVTYGPHVSAYVRARGARNVHIAPQSVDNAFWRGDEEPGRSGAGVALGDTTGPGTGGWSGGERNPRSPWPAEASVKFLFAGRPTREKGLGVLIEAWSDPRLAAPSAALVLVGVGSAPPWVPAGGAVRPGSIDASCDKSDPIWMGPVAPDRLRALYAAADVLLVPSIPTRTFREPWGLVVNEAMNRKLPVIASDAVGAAAGGLVRDGRNGLVVPAGDATALAGAIGRLAADAPLRARLGAAGAQDVQAYTHDAWAGGFSSALGSLGLSREGRW